MGAPGSNKLQKRATLTEIVELISKGKTRKEIVDYLGSLGIENSYCYDLYHAALKEMIPEDDYLDAEKKYLIQKNLDRLETIINCSITGKLLGQKVGSRVLGWLEIGLPECESLLRYLKLVRVGDLCMLYQLAENMSYGYMALLYATGSS